MGELLGALALIAAVVGSILNFVHTERKFKATVYPVPKLWLGIDSYIDASSGQTIFWLKIENLNDRLHIMNTRISTSLSNPFRGWCFWKKWLPYTEDKGPDVGPNETTDRIRLTNQSSIENFISKQFRGQIIKEVPRNNVNPFYYCLVEEKPLELVVKIAYDASVLGTGTSYFFRYYTVKPIDGGKDRLVTSWDLKEIDGDKRSFLARVLPAHARG